MLNRLLIFSLLILMATSLCIKVSQNSGVSTFMIEGASGTVDRFNVSCENGDYFRFQDAEQNSAFINAPIVFYRFAETTPKTIEIPNYQPYFSCFEDHQGGCGLTCPNEKSGQCFQNFLNSRSFCYGYYLSSKTEYLAYSLIYVDALTVTSYKSDFYEKKTKSPNSFVESNFASVRYPMSGPWTENAMLTGELHSVNNNDNVTNYYYLPELNLLLSKKDLTDLATQKPKVSIGNQNGFDCKNQIPQVKLDTSSFNLKGWAAAPFNWIAVTQPAEKETYTAEEFVRTKLRYFSANGLKSALLGAEDIVWDPCNQDHFMMNVFVNSNMEIVFKIGVDKSWNYDKLCIILQEVGSTKLSLASFDTSSGTFKKSNAWTGLVSDNIISTYNVYLMKSLAENTLLPPESITTLSFDFTKEGQKPQVIITADKSTECEIRFSHTCVIKTSLPFTKDLTDCIPLHSKTFYTCRTYSAIVPNPVYMTFKLNVELYHEDDGLEKNVKIPSIEDTRENNYSQKESLVDYITDFSAPANIYRGLMVLSSAIGVVALLALMRLIMRRIHKRKNNYKVHSHVVQWRKI